MTREEFLKNKLIGMRQQAGESPEEFHERVKKEAKRQMDLYDMLHAPRPKYTAPQQTSGGGLGWIGTRLIFMAIIGIGYMFFSLGEEKRKKKRMDSLKIELASLENEVKLLENSDHSTNIGASELRRMVVPLEYDLDKWADFYYEAMNLSDYKCKSCRSTEAWTIVFDETSTGSLDSVYRKLFKPIRSIYDIPPIYFGPDGETVTGEIDYGGPYALPENTLGKTRILFNTSNREKTNGVQIVINRDEWFKLKPHQRFWVIFHEMGHALLDLDHDDDEVIMNTYMDPRMSYYEMYENFKYYYKDINKRLVEEEIKKLKKEIKYLKRRLGR